MKFVLPAFTFGVIVSIDDAAHVSTSSKKVATEALVRVELDALAEKNDAHEDVELKSEKWHCCLCTSAEDNWNDRDTFWNWGEGCSGDPGGRYGSNVGPCQEMDPTKPACQPEFQSDVQLLKDLMGPNYDKAPYSDETCPTCRTEDKSPLRDGWRKWHTRNWPKVRDDPRKWNCCKCDHKRPFWVWGETCNSNTIDPGTKYSDGMRKCSRGGGADDRCGDLSDDRCADNRCKPSEELYGIIGYDKKVVPSWDEPQWYDPACGHDAVTPCGLDNIIK